MDPDDVLKPPVEMVVNEWATASKALMSPAARRTNSATVRPT